MCSQCLHCDIFKVLNVVPYAPSSHVFATCKEPTSMSIFLLLSVLSHIFLVALEKNGGIDNRGLHIRF